MNITEPSLSSILQPNRPVNARSASPNDVGVTGTSGAAPAGPATSAAEGPPPAIVDPHGTLAAIERSWGDRSGPGDVDGSGIVDVNDLIRLLTSWPQDQAAISTTDGGAHETSPFASAADAAAPPPPTDPAPAHPAAGDVGTGEPDGELTLEGLRESWGRHNSPYDFDGDGAVDVDDLVRFLTGGAEAGAAGPSRAGASLSAPSVPELAVARPLSTENPPPASSAVIADPGAAAGKTADPARRLGDAITTQLSAAGFAERLPTNLAELLDALRLEPNAERQVQRELATKYGIGAAVNTVG